LIHDLSFFRIDVSQRGDANQKLRRTWPSAAHSAMHRMVALLRSGAMDLPEQFTNRVRLRLCVFAGVVQEDSHTKGNFDTIRYTCCGGIGELGPRGGQPCSNVPITLCFQKATPHTTLEPCVCGCVSATDECANAELGMDHTIKATPGCQKGKHLNNEEFHVWLKSEGHR
jgi:hypothetical protein